MKTYIVLLRGINVSGKNKLPMAALRELLNDLGFQKVQTYIQSGNIVLDTDITKAVLCSKIKEEILSRFGYEVPVMARTLNEWENAIANNPYPIANHKILAFAFLSELPKKQTIEVKGTKDDVYSIIEDVVYIYCPSGMGSTKLTNNLFEKQLEVHATSRNYRTSITLLEMAKNNKGS